jgi:hypothetical protein
MTYLSVVVSRLRWTVIVVLLLGIAARFLVAFRGHNYDFESYRIVVEIVKQGGNVYASTSRYNYGPIWAQLLRLIDLLASGQEVAFRFLLTAFLTLVDVGIFAVLGHKRGTKVASFFFLSPISIIITGYHSQFENLALLLGFLALYLLGEGFDRPLDARKLFGLGLLGLSLATKHILFGFPLWLAVKQKGMLQKTLVMLLPLSLFVLGFAPFWAEGSEGIVRNVFQYDSWGNPYFYRLVVPSALQPLISSRIAWAFALLFVAFVCRERTGFESLLIYTCVFTATAPAIANQYLAIPVAYVTAYPNPFSVLYSIIGAWHLLLDRDGLHILQPQQILAEPTGGTYWPAMVALLCVSLVWVLWRSPLEATLLAVWRELRIQFGHEA